MRHIPALDGLRGVAILMVMVHHQTLLAGGAWATLMDLGWAGVDLFFVLSGFLITGILFDAKSKPHYFRNFYARRTLRIFPLYYAVLLFSFVVLPRLPLAEAQVAKVAALRGSEWWYWTYLQNVAMARAGEFPHAVLGISWSLAIEEQFYVVWPLVVALVPRRPLKRFCAFLFVGAAALRCLLALGGQPWLPAYVLTPCRMDALAAGAWIALAVRGRRPLAAFVPWAKVAAAAGLLGVAGVALAAGGTGFKLRGFHTVGFSLLALLFGGWLLLAVAAPEGSRHQRLLSGRFLTTFGKYSYALYLFHMPCRVLVSERLFLPSGGLEQGAFYVVATLLPLGLAWLSWHLLEKRFLAWKRYFPR